MSACPICQALSTFSMLSIAWKEHNTCKAFMHLLVIFHLLVKWNISFAFRFNNLHGADDQAHWPGIPFFLKNIINYFSNQTNKKRQKLSTIQSRRQNLISQR